MPEFPMNPNPRMTRYLVEKNRFAAEPFNVVDVGASGGIEEHWDHFANQVRIIAFEPNVEECARLNTQKSRVTYYPCALGQSDGDGMLNVFAHPAASSLYRVNPEFWSRRHVGSMHQLVEQVRVPVRRLDNILSDENIDNIDFIKLDVEGSEFDVLKGALKTLASPTTLGVTLEFFFHKNCYLPREGQRYGSFFEIHPLLSKYGFELYDLCSYRFSRAALPQPFMYHFKNSRGDRYAGPTIRGQVVQGDALYLKDPLWSNENCFRAREPSPTLLLKAACMFELFGLNDCAAEVVLFHKDTILAKENPQKLLDLLTTELAGDRQSYQEYVGLYEQDISAFMPAEGYRYPDHTAPTFDKVLVRRASRPPAFAALNLGKAKFSRLKRLIQKLKGP